MAEIRLSVPDGQRYSCRQCGWCCRGWRILVEPADRDRILTHDWAQDSPRLQGVQLFDEQKLPGQPVPSIQLAQIDGRCVFLEDDNRCLIHKVLGESAKPFTCRRFPYLLSRTSEGVLVGADYACPALIRSEGEPFTPREELVREWLEALARREGLGPKRATDPEVVLSPDLRLSWPAYLGLERALLQILSRRGFSVTERWLAGGALLLAMAAWSSGLRWLEEPEIAAWLKEWGEEDYRRVFEDTMLSSLAPVLPGIPRLATLIGYSETPHVVTSGPGSAAIGYAVAVASGSGSLYLSTLGEWVDLDSLGSVDRDMDRPEFDDYLTRFLSNYLLRKSLLESPNLEEGWDYLGNCFALVGWYAAASASIHGRARVGEDDLVTGIQLVEKVYVP